MAKSYIETQYTFTPSGDFPVVNAEDVWYGDDSLDDIVQNLEDVDEAQSLKITNLEQSDTALDARVTALEEGGGGGGNYPDLSNKPSINGVTLVGNLTDTDLHIVGEQGPKGDTGPQGPKGDTGPQGPPGQNATTTAVATQSANGLMSSADKTKVDGIATGATKVTESTVSGWGFTKNIGNYSKPSSGIPKTDLSSAVQTSLDKADTALQTHQSLANYVQTTDSRLNLTSILANSLDLYGINVEGLLNIMNANGTYTKVIGKVDLGDLNWNMSTAGIFYADFNKYIPSPKPSPDVYKAKCDKYAIYRGDYSSFPNKSMYVVSRNFSSTSRLAVKDLDYSSAANFKSACTGVILYYELPKPIISKPVITITEQDVIQEG